MTLRLPPEIEADLKQVAETEHRSVQQTVLVAIEEYLSTRETAEILADPVALRNLAETGNRSSSATSSMEPKRHARCWLSARSER